MNKIHKKLSQYFTEELESDFNFSYDKDNDLISIFTNIENNFDDEEEDQEFCIDFTLSDFDSFPKNLFANCDINIDHKNSNINLDSINVGNNSITIKNYMNETYNTSLSCKNVSFEQCDFKNIQSNYKNYNVEKELEPNTLYLNNRSKISFSNCSNLINLNFDFDIKEISLINTKNLSEIKGKIRVDCFFSTLSCFNKLPDDFIAKKELSIQSNYNIKSINNIACHEFEKLILNNTSIEELPNDLKTLNLNISKTKIRHLNKSINIFYEKTKNTDKKSIVFFSDEWHYINSQFNRLFTETMLKTGRKFTNTCTYLVDSSIYNSCIMLDNSQYDIPNSVFFKFSYANIDNLVYKIIKGKHLIGIIALNNDLFFIENDFQYNNKTECGEIEILNKNIFSIFYQKEKFSEIEKELFYEYLTKFNENGELFYFTYFSKIDKIKKLLKKYDNKEIFDCHGNSIFKYVRDKETFKTLLESSISINFDDKYMFKSEYHGLFDKILIKRNIKPNISIDNPVIVDKCIL